MPPAIGPRLSSRALLFDADGRLVLIRRRRPGSPSYLTTPGGGQEAGETPQQAVARECAEELGASITVGEVVYVSYTAGDHPSVQRFYLARLDSIDPTTRTGHEFSEPWRGSYETVRVDSDDAEALATLRPSELVTVLTGYGPYLAEQAASLT
ncbi:NUDIX domain-containing protein [Parenemella sanctibonifatiensis]|uniref:NUDIX hydrolase n=1 Tax=Parenemella sanctibonifatiensis TaxID=2016505 RepID=A0A255EHW4_9ACTN|nr:NUDIX hydrolase [Parenemella sanctibonifatiensis]OYN91114.1 NUDIX hydrolase [Parenemella sanctibonifatiensis]